MHKTWIYLVIILLVETLRISAKLDPNTEWTILNFYINLESKLSKNDYENNILLEEITSFKRKMESKLLRKKRDDWYHTAGLDTDLMQSTNSDIYRYNGFVEMSTLPATNAKDMTTFYHQLAGRQFYWYAAILKENFDPNYGTITLQRHDKNVNSWITAHTENVVNPSKIFSLTFSGGTILVLTHKSSSSPTPGTSEGITIFILDDNMRLHTVQSLDTAAIADVALWKDDQNIFMALACDHTVNDGYISVESDSPVYLWKGNHFDLHQYIATANAKKIIPFHIGSSMFMAVTNHQNNYGETKILSEIFKYDAHENQFTSYQKLASNGATEMIFFRSREGTYQESYLIIVNEENRGRPQVGTTQSVIYKLQDDYFIPFQEIFTMGGTKWFPLEGQAENFILMSISEYSKIDIFQYNGWNFEDIPTKNYEWAKGIETSQSILKRCVLHHTSILAFSDESKQFIKMNQPVFTYSNDLSDLKSKLFSWCQEVGHFISCSQPSQHNYEEYSNEFLTALKQNTILNGKGIHLDKEMHLNHATIDKIETSVIYADDTSLNSDVIQNMNNLYSFFEAQIESLKVLEDMLPQVMFDDSTVYLDSMHVKNMEFDCDNEPCQLNDVNMSILNSQDIKKYQREVLYTEMVNEFYDHLEFDDLVVEHEFNIGSINDKSIERIGLVMQQLAKANGVSVNGNVYISEGLTVNGVLDKVKLSPDTILLKNEDQVLKGDFKIPEINTILLEAELINDLSFGKLKEIVAYENKTINTPYVLSQLTAESAFIEGLVNNVKFKSIVTDTLKLTGDQTFSGAFQISNLETIDVSTSPSIASNILNQLITIDEGSFEVNQDVQFDNLNLKSIVIGERLNNINVLDDELLVLLLDSPKMQRVTGNKLFSNVELMGPINLQAKINSASLDRKNPVTMVEEPLILMGNYIIHGNVSVERSLGCGDLKKKDSNLTVKELQQKALKLSEGNITMPFIFSQPLEVKDISCDKINGLKPTSWISTQRDDIIMVTGKKMFPNNLNIQGSCSIVNKINNINPRVLDKSIVKTYGDQLIRGKIFLDSMATRRLSCQNISFAGRSMENVLRFSGDHKIPGETTINFGAKANEILTTRKLNIAGKISGYNMQGLIQDTVLRNSREVEIFGDLVMKEPLHIQNLDLEQISGIESPIHSSENWNREVLFSKLDINNPIKVERIIFDTSISGISKADFGYSWLLSEGDQIIHGNQNFDFLICDNEAYVESGKVNNIVLSKLFSDVVWISDDAFLRKGVFANGLKVNGSLIINGSVNNLYIPNDLVLKTSINDQYMFGHKTLKNIQIYGKIKTDYINGLSLKELCLITQNNDEQYLPSLYINGSLYFHNEPGINMLHNVNIENLMKNIWFLDMPAKLYGNNYFRNIVATSKLKENGVSVRGVDLQWLSENYLSLTLDQDITGRLDISYIYGDIVKVLDETFVGENINGINLEAFYQNTLHTMGKQSIVSSIDFDHLSVHDDLNLLGNINDLNLTTDVYHISGSNFVEWQYFNNMEIDYLKLSDGNLNFLQNVDLKKWSEDVVNKNALQGVIGGIKKFKSFNVKDLSISGYINERILPVDKILSSKTDQVITGRIDFMPKDKPTSWHLINVHGRTNNINISDAFNSLLKRDGGTSIFTSPKVFEHEISANNVHFDTLINQENNSDPSLVTPHFKDFAEKFNSLAQFAEEIYNNSLSEKTH